MKARVTPTSTKARKALLRFHNEENIPPENSTPTSKPPVSVLTPVRVPLAVVGAGPNEEPRKLKQVSEKQSWQHKSVSDTAVKVVVRVRPMNRRELAKGETRIVQATSRTSLVVENQQYTFDAVAGEAAGQHDVFDMVGLPMVEHCLAGFNTSIFAFGQTGSGKTYTMWGTVLELSSGMFLSDDSGLAPKVFKTLFPRIQKEEERGEQPVQYQCRCSFLEIYNEQIKDLLDPTAKALQVREDAKQGVYIDNLSEEPVSSVTDINRLLLKGLANKRVGCTGLNYDSSRSHCVFTCIIEIHLKNVSDGTSSIKSSKINLVDLAGSERQRQTGTAGERLKEAGNINRSLSQLGNVINILADIAQTGKQRHVPYRDSRLTFLLQESIGGNSQLAVICAVSPASSCKNETVSTLRFAQRAKNIQNKAVVNEETTSETDYLQKQIQQLKCELKKFEGLERQRVSTEPSCQDPTESQARADNAEHKPDIPAVCESGLKEKVLEFCQKLQPFYETDASELHVEVDKEERALHQASQTVVNEGEDGDKVDWMATAKSLQEKMKSYEDQIANEKNNTRTLREALEVALTSNAKVLEQYMELEERHAALLTKQRILREGSKQLAVRLGAIATSGLKSENQRDANVSCENQVEDEKHQDVRRLTMEIEELKAMHNSEMNRMQQKLVSQRLTTCSMCRMAKQVSFKFNDGDN